MNNTKSQNKLSSSSILLTTTRQTNYHYCYRDILYYWLRRSSYNIKVRIHLTAIHDRSYKNAYNQYSNSDNQIMKNNVLKLLIDGRKFIDTKNRKANISKFENQTRMKRDILRENTLNDADEINSYINDDRSYFKNPQEDINQQKKDFNYKYYLPTGAKFKMSKS